MKKLSLVIASAVGLILLFVIGTIVYRQMQIKKYDFMAQQNASTFVRPHSQTLGSDDARVYLVEFSDPACETCAAFHPLVKEIMAAHPGKIKLVIRYAPFHKGADYFVRILEAAKKQGKYWETLEVMFKTQGHWASHHNPQPQLIWRFLPQVGLDIAKLKQDMQDPEIQYIIAQDLADVKTLNVRKTPGFFVNGKPLVKFGRKNLRDLIEAEIAEAY
jgi:protein-disulfide isomerase